jgi:hypothetical protein
MGAQSLSPAQTGFLRDWPRYRPIFWIIAAGFGLLGALAIDAGWGERLLAWVVFSLLGALLAMAFYPVFWGLCRITEALDARIPKVAPPQWPKLPELRWPTLPKPSAAKPVFSGTRPRARPTPPARYRTDEGVRVVPPARTAQVGPEDRVGLSPGVAWLAERMAAWRARLAQGPGWPRGKAWNSVEEAAVALKVAVIPAIRRLGRTLNALSEAAANAPSIEAEREAAHFEAALEHWLETGAELRARRFPPGFETGWPRYIAILDKLDAQLERLFDTVIGIARNPHAMSTSADVSGRIHLEVNFGCANEVADFARWAQTHVRARRNDGFWWLVGAFTLGYWLGE